VRREDAKTGIEGTGALDNIKLNDDWHIVVHHPIILRISEAGSSHATSNEAFRGTLGGLEYG
jgi:hypothetical protein